MKWNSTSASAACITVGLAGFLAGRMTSADSGGDSEAGQLIERSGQISSGSAASPRDGSASRLDDAGRPISKSGRSKATFDEHLTEIKSSVRSGNARARSRAMQAWIDSLAPDEFEDAALHFRFLGDPEEGSASAFDRSFRVGINDGRMGEYLMLLAAWAEIDPAAALAHTTMDSYDVATNAVLATWASRDPEAAIAWVKANHEGVNVDASLFVIMRSVKETNPARATELIKKWNNRVVVGEVPPNDPATPDR